MNKLFSKIKNTLKWVVLGFVFLMQTACGNSYYSETFPLNFDPNKQVQNFEFELNVKRNQDKDKSHTMFLIMYFNNTDDWLEFRNKGEITYDNNLIFKKMKIKISVKDITNNKIIAEIDEFSTNFAHGTNDLLFSVPLYIQSLKKGRYILSLTLTQVEPFDYSKVQKMEILFTRPSYK